MGLSEILIQITGPRFPLEVTVDRAARAAYVRVRAGNVFRTIEHSDGVLLDVDAEGRLLGFEILAPAQARGIADAADYYIRQENLVGASGGVFSYGKSIIRIVKRLWKKATA